MKPRQKKRTPQTGARMIPSESNFAGLQRTMKMNHQSSEKARKGVMRWQLGIFGLIVLSAIVVAAVEKSDRRGVLNTVDVERAHLSVEIIQRASADLAIERGLVYLALQIPSQERALWLVEIDNSRASVDRALDAAGKALVEGQWTKTSWPLGRMKAQIKHLVQLRRAADGQLAAPLSDRSIGLAEVWLREATAIIQNLNTVLQVVHTRIAYADPDSRFSLRLQRYAANIAELAGRERALIAAAAAADKPLNSRQLILLKGYRLQMAEDWRRISIVAKSSPIAVGLSGELDEARREYSRVLVEAAEQMVNDRNGGGAFPQTAADWFDESSRAINSVLKIGAVAGARVIATTERTS